MYNKIQLIGNLGADPEIKVLDGGAKVAKFSMATSESWKDKQGNKVEDTQWHNIVAWRGLADVIEKFLKKGSRVFVEGKLTYRTYDDQNGEKKYYTEIVAREMKMLDRKEDGQSSNSSPMPDSEPGNSSASTPASTSSQQDNPNEPEDDLPF